MRRWNVRAPMRRHGELLGRRLLHRLDVHLRRVHLSA
jgi:hypothetical protein